MASTRDATRQINKLIRIIGSVKEVAKELEITERYVYMISKGEKKVSPALAKVINFTLISKKS